MFTSVYKKLVNSRFHDQCVVLHVHNLEYKVIIKVLFSGSRFILYQMNSFYKVSRQKHRRFYLA